MLFTSSLILDLVLLVLIVVYFVWAARIVLKCQEEFGRDSRWQKAVKRGLRASLGNKLGMFVFVIGILMFLLIQIPFAVVILMQMHTVKANHAHRVKKEREERRAENARRKRERETWLLDNPPVLYFNTINGVTAVLRPKDFAESRKVSSDRIVDGYWTHENVSVPWRDTFVFVTKEGDEQIRSVLGPSDSRYKIAGTLSELNRLVEQTGAKLLPHTTIFVPWINESVAPIQTQKTIVRDCFRLPLRETLIDTQAPKELQPLPEL